MGHDRSGQFVGSGMVCYSKPISRQSAARGGHRGHLRPIPEERLGRSQERASSALGNLDSRLRTSYSGGHHRVGKCLGAYLSRALLGPRSCHLAYRGDQEGSTRRSLVIAAVLYLTYFELELMNQ